MHQATRVAWNAALMLAKQVVTAVMSVVFIGYLARNVGVSAWGEFQASLAITAMATIVAGLGVRGYLAREIAVSPDLGPKHVGSALVVRGVMATVMLAVVSIFTFATRDGLGEELVLIAAVSQLATQLYTTMWLSFEAHERFQYIVYVELGARLFVVAIASMCVAAGLGIVAAAFVFAIGNVIELGLTYHFLCSRMYRPRFEATTAELISIARMSLPFGVVGVLLGVQRLCDRVMLRWLDGEAAVGVFSAAWVLIEQLEMIADLVFGAAFAAGMRLYAHDRKGFSDLYRSSVVVAAALAFPIAAGVCLLAPDIIKLVYGGKEFSGAMDVLAVLAWHVPATFAFQVAALPLLASKREGIMAAVLVPALVVNIALDAWLIPTRGALGAAVTAIVVGTGVVVASAWLSRDWMKIAPLSRVLGAIASTSIMGLAAFFAKRSFGMWAAIAAGATAHATLLFALRVVTPDEVRLIIGRRKAAKAPASDGAAKTA